MQHKPLPAQLIAARPGLADDQTLEHPSNGPAIGNPPAKYTRGLHDSIINYIKAGQRPVAAARMAGITANTFYQWMQQGKSGNPHLTQFVEDIDTAEGVAEGRLVDSVMMGADENPDMALKMLTAKYPEAYAKDVAMRVQSELEMAFKRLETLPPAIYEMVVACLAGQTFTPLALPPVDVSNGSSEE